MTCTQLPPCCPAGTHSSNAPLSRSRSARRALGADLEMLLPLDSRLPRTTASAAVLGAGMQQGRLPFSGQADGDKTPASKQKPTAGVFAGVVQCVYSSVCKFCPCV